MSSPDSQQQIHSQQLDSQAMGPDSSLANLPDSDHAGDDNHAGHHGPSRSVVAGYMVSGGGGHNNNNHQHHLSHKHGPQNHHPHHPQAPPQHHNNQQQQYPYQHGRFSNHHQQRGDSESNLNHVLLITVMNPHYPITCDLIHQICSNYGKVNRIVIFKKNGVQAMVEFDGIESAKRAKSMLSGCDIYSGCCTLRIEYAKPSKLNICRNDSNSYDYTNPNLASRPGGNGAEGQGSNADEHHQTVPGHIMHVQSPHGGGSGGSGAVGGGHGGAGSDHHQSRSIGSGDVNHNAMNHNMAPSHHYHLQAGTQQHNSPPSHGSSINNYGSGYDSYGPANQGAAAAANSVDDHGPPTNHHHHQANSYPRQGHTTGHHHVPQQHQHHRHPRSNMTQGALFSSHHGPVMMLYGLRPDKFNCDRIFNLLCMYGNISKVKFLKSKEGCAMVQMGDGASVERCIDSLNDVALFDTELQISYSKQPFLHDVVQPFILPDGSLSFKDFQGNKNNRFKNPEVASKNRILPPSQVLHFFNAPFGITEDELIHIFQQNTDREPVSIKIFTPKGK